MRLSAGNLRRARSIIRREKKYRKLSTIRRNLAAFRVAWDIQKGHLKKRGRR